MRVATPKLLLFAALAAALALGGVHAQSGKVQITGGVPAVFLPTEAELLAAIDCSPPDCLEPLPPATSLKLIRQRRNHQPVLRVWRSSWTPDDGLELWVRYTVDGNQSAPYTTGWVEIDASVQQMLETTDPNTSIDIEYQLRVGADAAAGSYQAEVFYDAGSGSGGVQHLVTVDIAPVIGLRIEGAPAGAEATVAFDYTPSPSLYLDAVTTGTLLAPTGGDLVRVEVFTNSPGGYRVSVAVDQVANSDGNTLAPDALLLAGVPAPDRVFVGSGPTDGYATLITADQYRLAVDGGEDPGSYRLSLTFTAEMLP